MLLEVSKFKSSLVPVPSSDSGTLYIDKDLNLVRMKGPDGNYINFSSVAESQNLQDVCDIGSTAVLTSLFSINTSNSIYLNSDVGFTFDGSDLSISGNKITDLSDPSASNDAVNFNYLNGQSGSGSPIGSVTPRYIGDTYLNTSDNQVYSATGLTNNDWTPTNSNIIVQDNDVTIGTVTNTLNFEGNSINSIVDEGSGKTTIDISQPDSNTTTKGIIEIATQTEVNTGTDNTRAVTPLTLQTKIATLLNRLNNWSPPPLVSTYMVGLGSTLTLTTDAKGYHIGYRAGNSDSSLYNWNIYDTYSKLDYNGSTVELYVIFSLENGFATGSNTVKLECSYKFMSEGDNFESSTNTVLSKTITLNSPVAYSTGNKYTVKIGDISGASGSNLIKMQVKRISSGGGADTFGGTFYPLGFQLKD